MDQSIRWKLEELETRIKMLELAVGKLLGCLNAWVYEAKDFVEEE